MVVIRKAKASPSTESSCYYGVVLAKRCICELKFTGVSCTYFGPQIQTECPKFKKLETPF